MKYVITIGREYGSGGRFIGRMVAEKLGIDFYDNELIYEACKDSGISPKVFETFDEKTDGFFSAAGMYSYDMSLSQKVFLAQFEAIKKIASEKSCVIVGRCADYVLRDMENVCNIFICAPMEEKIKRAVEFYGIKIEKASSVITKRDKKRKTYYNFYTDMDWGKASNYDLCINSKLGVENCVNVIVTYVKERFKIE
ncbi:MAG: cytidylate kinase-like family protein [Acholeplasmatales bacterium]|nr:cytidylate kinase-like family protein [Acholeplasmatales bacterium]